MKTIISLVCYFAKNSFILIYGTIFSTLIIAAAPVENIKANSNKNSQIVSKTNPQPLNIDAHYQIQILKQEVRALRGIIEEVRNEDQSYIQKAKR